MRSDLTPSQQAVQASHACIEATKAFPLDGHPSVIILAAKNEHRLRRAQKYLQENGIKHVHFCEPDAKSVGKDEISGPEMTAIATEPIEPERRHLFQKYQLLDHKQPDAEHVKYALKFPNGSYYCWRGECSRSEDRTWQLDDANLWSSAEDANYYGNDKEGKAVPVHVAFSERGGAA